MTYIYIVKEHGDDYHGCRLVSAHSEREAAKSEQAWLECNQVPCSDCGHTYFYSVNKIKLDEKESDNGRKVSDC